MSRAPRLSNFWGLDSRCAGALADLTMRRIFVVGTADTKGEELAYLRRMVADAGGTPIVVDVGIGSARCDVDIPRSEIAAHHPDGMHFLCGTDRGEAVTAMAEAFARFVATRRDIDAMLGIGGGGGTFIVTKGMQALKVGLPKLMVSTLASGDVGAYVDIADITMMPSVTDFGRPEQHQQRCASQRGVWHRRHGRCWPSRGHRASRRSR